MKYTLEELKVIPISLLRGIDIQTKEEEELVQKILNERLVDMPIEVDLTLTSKETDAIKTPEDEARLQAKIDTKKAEARLKLLPHSEVIIPSESPSIDENVLLDGETVDMPNNEEPIREENVSKKFCEFCDSKGVRHKKDCTRLQANVNINV